MEDCALENFGDHWKLRALAQLQPAAAGLERSAAHPARRVGLLKSAGAQRRPRLILVEPAPGMEARRAETIEHIELVAQRGGSVHDSLVREAEARY